MPNRTLTLQAVTPGSNGWDAVDADGIKWWLPAKNREGVSNESVSADLTGLIGQPSEFAVFEKPKDDGGTLRMIFGKAVARPAGGGGGFKGMTPEQREAERRSIEAQGALKAAVEIAGLSPASFGDADAALAWVEMVTPRLAALIRATAEQKSPEEGKRIQPSGPSTETREGSVAGEDAGDPGSQHQAPSSGDATSASPHAYAGDGVGPCTTCGWAAEHPVHRRAK